MKYIYILFWRTFVLQFLVLPNFHSCFYNCMETQKMFSISLSKYVLFLWRQTRSSSQSWHLSYNKILRAWKTKRRGHLGHRVYSCVFKRLWLLLENNFNPVTKQFFEDSLQEDGQNVQVSGSIICTWLLRLFIHPCLLCLSVCISAADILLQHPSFLARRFTTGFR